MLEFLSAIPNTGDHTNIAAFIVLGIAAVAAVVAAVVLSVFKKKP